MIVKFFLLRKILNLTTQYTSIGGQAVIEGVMMRSPNAFVVAVRKSNGQIRLRRDQWYGFIKKFKLLEKPFLRGVLVLIETMANGIVSLNYSASISLDDELREDALRKGITSEEYENNRNKKDKVSFATFLSIVIAFILGMGLFVLLPHALTALLERTAGTTWGLQSFEFHAVDGIIKALVFIGYIFSIGFLPDVKRVFQYHGAEHKVISAFEANEELTVKNAMKYSTFHPRCGTTFLFFLLFVSIVLFSMIFAVVPIGTGHNVFVKHFEAIIFKICLTFPIAGISYELIKFSGKYSGSKVGRIISYPGMLLQRLTTSEPSSDQLEVAIASIKTVLLLEEKYKLNSVKERVISKDEIDVDLITDIEMSNYKMVDFVE